MEPITLVILQCFVQQRLHQKPYPIHR